MSAYLLKPANDLTASIVQDALLLAGCDIALKTILKWNMMQWSVAYDWAMRVHLRASDNIIRVPNRPKFLPIEESL